MGIKIDNINLKSESLSVMSRVIEQSTAVSFWRRHNRLSECNWANRKQTVGALTALTTPFWEAKSWRWMQKHRWESYSLTSSSYEVSVASAAQSYQKNRKLLISQSVTNKIGLILLEIQFQGFEEIDFLISHHTVFPSRTATALEKRDWTREASTTTIIRATYQIFRFHSCQSLIRFVLMWACDHTPACYHCCSGAGSPCLYSSGSETCLSEIPKSFLQKKKLGVCFNRVRLIPAVDLKASDWKVQWIVHARPVMHVSPHSVLTSGRIYSPSMHPHPHPHLPPFLLPRE